MNGGVVMSRVVSIPRVIHHYSNGVWTDTPATPKVFTCPMSCPSCSLKDYCHAYSSYKKRLEGN